MLCRATFTRPTVTVWKCQVYELVTMLPPLVSQMAWIFKGWASTLHTDWLKKNSCYAFSKRLSKDNITTCTSLLQFCQVSCVTKKLVTVYTKQLRTTDSSRQSINETRRIKGCDVTNVPPPLYSTYIPQLNFYTHLMFTWTTWTISSSTMIVRYCTSSI